MMSDEWISIARQLARLEPGRPKAISLRRAVSSAYYAMFHALSFLCADQLVGASKHNAVFTPMYRALDHGRCRAVLGAMRRSSGTAAEIIALAFEELQAARHDADYNPERFRFNRNSTLDLIDSAEQAIAAIDALPGDDKLALAVKLVIKPR